MPRINLSSRSTIKEKLNSFSLLNDFVSYTGEFTYDKKDNLIFWGDFCQSAGKSPGKDRSVSNFSMIPVNSAVTNTITTEEEFCGTVCALMIRSIRQNTTNGFYLVDHDTLSFGNGSTDSAFSLSLWYKPSSNPHNITNKAFLISKSNEYDVWLDPGSSRLVFRIVDDSANAKIVVASTANPLITSTWNHILVTYDGSASEAGMNIYVNSSNVVDSTQTDVTTSGTYTAMENLSNHVYYGSTGAGGTSLVTGFLTEPAIWNGELSSENVSAVYNATLTCILKYSDVLGRDSGYINLSPRIMLRERDNATGSYPTLTRTGDRDRKGKYNLNFNDLNTMIFGKRIFTNFALTNKNINILVNPSGSSDINLREFAYTKHMKISRETEFGIKTDRGAFVFSGPGDSEGRWIQTKEKVRNPIIYFDLLQGPYDITSGLVSGGGLNLGTPKSTNENLKVQISTDNTSWKTIKTILPKLDINNYYDNIGGYDNKRKERFSKIIKIHFTEIKDPGSSFYIRWIQEKSAITKISKEIWAIRYIDIESINQNIRYPLLIDHDIPPGKKADRDFIATPHTRSDLTGLGRTLSGVTDTMLKFTPGENISPFYDNYAIEDSKTAFFDYGIAKSEYPGFDQRLASKTKITIDLSPKEQTTFGMTTNLTASTTDVNSGDDTSGRKQKLMVYWNNVDKKWEKLPNGVNTNNYPAPFSRQLEEMIKYAEIGFSSVGIAASGSGNPLDADFNKRINNLGEDALSGYVRPIKTFGFPYAKKFAATSSQAYSLDDISHPFVLEKASLVFNTKMEFAPNGDSAEDAYNIPWTYQWNFGLGSIDLQAIATDPLCKYIMPTFFMLRQFKSQGDFFNNYEVEISGSIDNPYTSGSFRDTIPGIDTQRNIYVDTKREIITYGQVGFLVSGSNPLSSAEGRLNIDQILDRGLKRDLLVNVLAENGQGSSWTSAQDLKSLTGSYQVNFKSMIGTINKRASALQIKIANSNAEAGLILGDSHGGRSNNENLDSASRTLFNGQPFLEKGESYRFLSSDQAHHATGAFIKSSPGSAKFHETTSPYILMPGDKLIFGWQYPLSLRHIKNSPSNTSTKYNSMTLFGEAKLHLYGSLIKNNKEFHDTLNQNLTSDNVHEVIGNEPITDQFYLATRNSLTGTYLDNLPIGINEYSGSTYHNWLRDVDQGVGSLLTKIPKKRIGTYVGSNINIDGAINAFGLANNEVEDYSQFGQTQKLVNIQSETDVFVDRIKLFLTSAKPIKRYFVTHSVSQMHKAHVAPLSKSFKSRKKYYFQHDKFGQYAHFIRQGRDSKHHFLPSKFIANSKQKTPTVTESPIQVTFVTGQITNSILTIKNYKRNNPNSNYQSSNLSTECTQSFPFIEHHGSGLILSGTNREQSYYSSGV